MKRVFVLGAKDPEMDEIEKILKENNQEYVYAELGGKRCHPANSYKAVNDLSLFDKIIYIESDTFKKYDNSTYLDHHKEGDYGYDKKYHLFLDASSIGQLVAYLIDNDLYNIDPEDYWMTYCFKGYMYFKDQNSWFYRKSNKEFIKIPEKIVLVAASDHSLSEAYKGLCVGVDKNHLIEERTLEISSAFNNNVDLVNQTMAKYLNNFKAHSSEIFDLRHLDLGTGYSIDYLCLRELAISYNQPILVKTRDSDTSPIRVMFLALSEEQAQNILDNKSYKGTPIKNIFGVPVRGYVGGILKD